MGRRVYLSMICVSLICNQGTPAAYFPSTFCDFSTYFDPQNIIINLTLCKCLPRAGNDGYKHPYVGGDWAGSTYSQGTGCPSTCVGEFLPNPPAAVSEVHSKDYVNYNASAFTDAYFDFASIHVYQNSRKNHYRRQGQHFT